MTTRGPGQAAHDAAARAVDAAVPPGARPEVWAGIECTVNRVEDRYRDQSALNGHDAREADLDLLAALGIRALRYPVLWERVAPEGIDAAGLARADWSWTDRRLARLRALGIRPIVTLLHHGSGPRGTSLVDPAFPARFAAFARAAAERYPWVDDWTPINEPLTTARFSALYGLWYPHARDAASFGRALVNQLEGVRRAMHAIRAANPRARLVQTEDLGKSHATPSLAYQAAFENERRWITGDLLTGRLRPTDAMWRFLVAHGGIDAAELAAFADAPCPPDVMGYNHYLTSERFLDRRLSRYPAHTHGGNGRHRYADVEAVRVLADGCDGPERLLAEAWERHGVPLAVTEAHLGCTREQQLRWLARVWEAACALRARGVPLVAVTAWSALGAFDWNSLLTRADGCYEPGVFDVRGTEHGAAPRPTALATLVRDLAVEGRSAHPALAGAGWWEVPERLLYPTARKHRNDHERRALSVVIRGATRDVAHARVRGHDEPQRPLLVTGARGTLGAALVRACAERGLAAVALGRQELDIADGASIDAALAAYRPWGIVNAAGFVRVDDAEREREACWRENACGPALLAERCADQGVRLATFSSDLVFGAPIAGDDGRPRAFVESDAPAPRNAYGASKAEAEARVLARMPGALVIRTSAFFGPWDEWNFATIALRELAAGRPFAALTDYVVSPTYVPALVHATLDLLIDDAGGIWHLANQGAVTWYDFARDLASRAGVSTATLHPTTLDASAFPAPRPRWSVLDSVRGRQLGTLAHASCDYLAARSQATSGTPADARHPRSTRRTRRPAPR